MNTDIKAGLQAQLRSLGCEMTDVDLLQQADSFLDTAGEDFRRMMFLTETITGEQMCLRPEFTIPVCKHHINLGNIPIRYGYCGTVFRQRHRAASEFVQAGVEDLGNPNLAEADTATLADAIDTLENLGASDLFIQLGDEALFSTLLDSFDIPAPWRQKLNGCFGDTPRLLAAISDLSSGTASELGNLPQEVTSLLESGDRQALIKWITASMAQAALPLTGSRTPAAIAERMTRKFQLCGQKLPADARTALEAYLAIDCDMNEAQDQIAEFAATYFIDLGSSQQLLTRRHALIGERLGGTPMNKQAIRFKASFGRKLDYYSGFVFEIFAGGQETRKPLCGGGRYDKLMEYLGAPSPIPAVGFSLWADRLTETLAENLEVK